MKKQLRLALYFGLCLLLLLPATVSAAPLLETEAVNLPGWLGVVLTVVALLMPVLFRLWMRQNK